jgi:hypothetical protein
MAGLSNIIERFKDVLNLVGYRLRPDILLGQADEMGKIL